MSGHEHASRGNYERTDINTRGVGWSGFWILVLVAVACVSMAWLYGFLLSRQAPEAPESALATSEPPPKPRLQVNPPAELKQQIAADKPRLEGYAWIDSKNNIVRIPIERAMELTAARSARAIPSRVAGNGVKK